jgi:hypothetical protein
VTGRVTALVAAAICTLLVVAVAPALAGPPRQWPALVVSHTGRDWKPTLAKPMFRSDHQWVPGESMTRTFYARNQSGERARLAVVVRVTDRRAWFRQGHVRMDVGVKGRWKRVRFAGSTGVRSLVIGAGEAVPVQVRVRLLGSADGSAMRRSMAFRVKLRLTELTR